MHVLMSTDAVGGVFSHTVTLGQALRRRGIDISIAVLGPPPTRGQLDALRALAPRAVQQLPSRLEWMQEPWADLARCSRELLEMELQLRPDVIHAGSYFCGSVGFQAPVLIVAHSDVVSWWWSVHGGEPPSAWERYRRLVRDGLRGAAAVVAPSGTMLAGLHSHYGTLPKRALVIHNGSRPGGAHTRREDFVLAAGRVWDPAKNLRALVEVAPRLQRPVLIAGELRDPEGAQAAAAARGHSGGARLLGQLVPADLAALRRRAGVFAAPARYEPFGLSILEAAGDRCALVLGDIPSLRELWDGCAEFVAPDDREALAFALRALLRREARAARLAERAAARASRLSVGRMAQSYSDLYRQLIGAERGVAAA